MNHVQGLHTETIEPNGYFSENLGPAKLLSHYHKFYFYFNITNLEVSYYKILSNVMTIDSRESTPIIRQLVNVLKENCKLIEEQLSKFKHREKRALINILGTTIKYITGNPDNNDLIEINKNLNSLFENQGKIVKQMNKYTSFANHITNRYSTDQKTIQGNINSSIIAINKVNNVLDTQLVIQYNNYISSKLLNTLQSIERTISLAFSEIINLEIISNTELIEIINHLKLIYKTEELLELDTIHVFKVLKFSKFRVLSANEIIACILYIPILHPSLFQYARIYPIPNLQSKVLIPPFKFHLQGVKRESWTDEECKLIEDQTVCVEMYQTNDCSLELSNSCMYAVANNNYKLYTQLKNGQLLVSCRSDIEIIEECPDKIIHRKLQNSVLVSSENNCKLTIGEHTFENTFSNFTFEQSLEVNNYEADMTVNLQLKHLDDLKNLKEEAKSLEKHVKLHPVLHIAHLSTTVVIIIILSIICIIIYVFRNKFINTFGKGKECTKTEEIRLREISQVYPESPMVPQNEDVLS